MKTFTFMHRKNGNTVSFDAKNELDAMGKLVTKVSDSMEWILVGISG